jgi:hypothetical protein
MGPMVPMPLGSTDGARTTAPLHTEGVTGSIPVAPTIDITLKYKTIIEALKKRWFFAPKICPMKCPGFESCRGAK